MKFVDAAGSRWITPSWTARKTIKQLKSKEADNVRTTGKEKK